VTKPGFVVAVAASILAIALYATTTTPSRTPSEIDRVFDAVKERCVSHCREGLRKKFGIDPEKDAQSRLVLHGCISQCACEQLGKLDTWQCPGASCRK